MQFYNKMNNTLIMNDTFAMNDILERNDISKMIQLLDILLFIMFLAILIVKINVHLVFFDSGLALIRNGFNTQNIKSTQISVYIMSCLGITQLGLLMVVLLNVCTAGSDDNILKSIRTHNIFFSAFYVFNGYYFAFMYEILKDYDNPLTNGDCTVGNLSLQSSVEFVMGVTYLIIFL